MNRKPKFSPLKIAYEHPSYKAGKNPSAFTVGEHTYITETRSYRLITPLFGGGVKAGVNDPITPIRASGIRGQLRFYGQKRLRFGVVPILHSLLKKKERMKILAIW